MQTQIIRRRCDNPKCDVTVDLEVPLKPVQETELSNWLALSKEHVLVSGQQPQALTKHGCCATCAVEILRNDLLDLPKQKVH